MFSFNPLPWLRCQRPNQKGRTRQQRPLLDVERLEDRLAPATLFVTTLEDPVNPISGKLSLREAIAIANAAPSTQTDTIVLGKGTYKSASGEFIITQSMTILGQGEGFTTVDGAELGRIFDVRGTIDATFANMSLLHGAGQNDGGAIQALAANLRVVNCQLSDNSGLEGGAIHDQGGNVTLIGSTVSDNVVQGDGGGINLGSGTLVLNSTIVAHNLAGGGGGGISSSATVTVTGSTISGNSASSSDALGGGGINAITAVLTNSTVSGNSASSQGGGINARTATLTNSTVSGNQSFSGGGIDAITLTLTNCTISGNHANSNGLGGGIYTNGGQFLNDTIAENSAGAGGGVAQVSTGPQLSVKNTIIALNLVPFDDVAGPDVFGDFNSLGHNLIGIEDITAGGFGAVGDQVGSPTNPLSPGLSAFGNHGGPTETYALLPGSPAIHTGADVATLSAKVTAATTNFTVSDTSPFAPGMLLRLGSEVVRVTEVVNNTLTVVRGVAGTMATAHALNTGLFLATDQRGVLLPPSVVDIGAF